MAKDKKEVITNKDSDSTPPGSGSTVARGVPERTVNDSRGESTPAPQSSSGDSVEPPKMAKEVIQTVPYEKPRPIAEARQKLMASLKSTPEKSPSKKSKGEKKISARTLAYLIRTIDSADTASANEITEILGLLEVSDEQLKQVRALANHPELFAGDQKPANLQVLGLPPGAQKPPEFDVAPGTTDIPDTRYYPTRFPMVPDEDDYEDGDIIYSVHEDQSFTVLSVEQQLPDWQASHHLPPMNVITRIGAALDETPKELKKRGLVNRNQIAEDYDSRVAEAK